MSARVGLVKVWSTFSERLARPTGRLVARIALPLAQNLLAILGAGFVAYGAWLIYAPAGFIVGGLFMLSVGVIGSLRTSQEPK